MLEDKTLLFSSNKNNSKLFNLSLDNINSCVIPTINKDEVEIQFNEPSDNNREIDSLIQITFHFPSLKNTITENDDENEDNEENEEMKESQAELFLTKIKDMGVLSSVTSDIIVEFTREQGNFVTPRGKYALQVTYIYLLRFYDILCDYLSHICVLH